MWSIYKKEMIDSCRDRRTLLLTVFLPILLMSGLLFFYESMLSGGEDQTFHIAVAEGSLDEVRAIFGEEEHITFEEVTDVEQVVTDGHADAGLELPSTFTEAVIGNEQATVNIYADSYSQTSALAGSMLESKLLSYNQQIVSSKLEQANMDPTVLQSFSIENIQTVEGDPGIFLIAFLIPMMLSIALGVGASPAAADLFAGEKERKTMEALLMTPVNRSKLLLSKWLTISTLAGLTGIITMIVIVIEVMLFADNLRSGFTYSNDLLIEMAIWAVVYTLSFGLLMASLLLLTSLMAKTVKEAQSYGTPVMMIPIVPALLTSGLGINEFTTTYFLIPFLNLFTVFKELLFGVIAYDHLLLAIGSNIIVSLVLVLVGRVLFLKDRWVLN